MKTFLNKYRWKLLFYISMFFLLFSLYFLITQPLFFNYRYSDNFFLSNLTFASEVELEKHVKELSEMNRISKEGQQEVVNYICGELKKNSVEENTIEIQKYKVKEREFQNIIVHFKENTKENISIPKYVIGGHYDTNDGTPGADDNASAVAGLLEISKILSKTKLTGDKNIDLVFYSTEEPPFFGTEDMGSFRHAQSLVNENITLVIVLEMIGFYTENKNSQNYPVPLFKYLYPRKGNFIAIVSNFSNISETRKVKSRFKAFLKNHELIETKSINAPSSIIAGVDFSDHRNYWKSNIPALMITDTSFYRNNNYHTKDDTYEKLDYRKMKEVVDATVATIISL